ncbi:MAG: hypothetical protein QOJ23_1147 [Actinomycetota bacterium]|nr:hypothetical protein [Actinomycetota bacterium]MDQ1499120.1 hypothetical protein [Actinomycetota bacterium]
MTTSEHIHSGKTFKGLTDATLAWQTLLSSSTTTAEEEK